MLSWIHEYNNKLPVDWQKQNKCQYFFAIIITNTIVSYLTIPWAFPQNRIKYRTVRSISKLYRTVRFWYGYILWRLRPHIYAIYLFWIFILKCYCLTYFFPLFIFIYCIYLFICFGVYLVLHSHCVGFVRLFVFYLFLCIC